MEQPAVRQQLTEKDRIHQDMTKLAVVSTRRQPAFDGTLRLSQGHGRPPVIVILAPCCVRQLIVAIVIETLRRPEPDATHSNMVPFRRNNGTFRLLTSKYSS